MTRGTFFLRSLLVQLFVQLALVDTGGIGWRCCWLLLTYLCRLLIIASLHVLPPIASHLSLSSFLSNCPSLSSLPLPSPPRRPAPCGTTLQFGDSVLDMGWPDHHSPPLSVTWRACNMMSAWLLSSPDNVVVVHCNAGKGRTG